MVPWFIFGACALLGFLLYSVILPYRVFWPSFTASNRIASIFDFLHLEFLLQKVKWIVVTFLPIVPLGIYLFYKKEVRARLINLALESLPILPLVLAIIISNSRPMFNPFTYYSVVPIFYFTVILFNNLSFGQHRKLSRMLTLAILLACLMGHRTIGLHDLNLAISTASPKDQIAHLVKPSSVVITDEYEANFFTENRKTTRVFHANLNYLKFDYLVRRKNAPHHAHYAKLSKFYRSWSEVCFENETWVVRCAYPSQRAVSG